MRKKLVPVYFVLVIAMAITTVAHPADTDNVTGLKGIFLNSVSAPFHSGAVGTFTRNVTTPELVGNGSGRASGFTFGAAGGTDNGVFGFINGEKVLPRPWVDVREYGAVGNGITDDTAAIQSAFDYVKRLNAAVLYLPRGTYKVTAGLDFTDRTGSWQHSVTIQGDGINATKIQSAGGINIVMDFGGRNLVNLNDFTISSPNASAHDNVGIARYIAKTPSQSGQEHTYRNIRVAGFYDKASLWTMGSEVNTHYDLQLMNEASKSAALRISYLDDIDINGHVAAPSGTWSNTTNVFYGGNFQGQANGTAAVLFMPGIADGWNFYGTYIVGIASNSYALLLGTKTSDSVQGKKGFYGVRFEGVDNTVPSVKLNGQSITDLVFDGCVFGAVGDAINYSQTTKGSGIDKMYFANNTLYNHNLVMDTVSRSNIKAGPNFYYHSTAVIINHLFSSYVEGETVLVGDDLSSIIVVNDGYNNFMKIRYGNGRAPHSGGTNQGSIVVQRPWIEAPGNLEKGVILTVNHKYWDPVFTGKTDAKEDYPVFYNGTSWRSLIALPVTPASSSASCKRGTTAYDNSYFYVCIADNTWKRGSIVSW